MLVTCAVIAAIVMLGTDPAVGAVCIGIAAGLVLPIGWPLHRWRQRRKILARADRQHQLYMRDPEAYLRRIEKGETP